MVKLKPRDTQTKVKHEILSRYLDTWAGIILGGIASSKRKHLRRFVYVDCFSSLGKYSGEREDAFHNKPNNSVYGSPILGIMALDKLYNHASNKGIKIQVNALLVEKDRPTYEILKQTLNEAGYSGRVIETFNFQGLTDGQIAIINADSIEIADQLLSFTTQPETWAFYLIDPYGPSGYPLTFIQKVISQQRHDAMINFIYEDLPRKGGLAQRQDLSPAHRKQVDNWTQAFGTDKWIKIAEIADLEGETNEIIEEVLEGKDAATVWSEVADAKEQRFVEAYKSVLSSIDSSLAIKLVNLHFSDKDRTIFYLFLTTHDPTGALALNEVLYKAEFLEHELRHRLRIVKKITTSHRQPFLIPIQDEELTPPKLDKANRPTSEEIGKVILQKCAGKQATKKEIYLELVDTDYFRNEVDKALKYLKREKLCHFDDVLKHYTKISFVNENRHDTI